ncbi:MAG: DUF1292 domain-containing protein [Thermoanaerobacteraceae bacterium]|uniref:UPF0473 protein GFC01_07675 n=1 Tax=Desulfofundulus thermobenzoicus TaxID=29376 RepID=A0A6N7IQF5_9FIRM|nr:DUF1292 domain-containing protein [Desulfofundulus thermobenzoicus]MBE3589139.1 DUF1292 domain-containing protein [Thermoanaerobacteraceae bacterium]MQL52151.1 DUF1292 domain-containing protein [Desulfofundulus thermobenzoicus]HHW42561.1 DUF1292 domain-containing protein [Desulfotomaculum sp.]
MSEHDHDHEHEQEEVITLVDEEGQEKDFEVIDIVQVDGSEYAILLPLEQTEEDEGEAIILKFERDEEGNEILVDIEDDEEWEKVADYWEEMVADTDS